MQSADSMDVLKEDVKHAFKSHLYIFDMINSQHIPVWRFLASDLLVMKDVEAANARVQCRDLGHECSWTLNTDTIPKAYVQLIRHWEEQHADVFNKRWKREPEKFLMELLGAIKY
jgi:predicted small metal-binding protein